MAAKKIIRCGRGTERGDAGCNPSFDPGSPFDKLPLKIVLYDRHDPGFAGTDERGPA
jgi:hypothetical protein